LQPPAGLIHVERLRAADAIEQILVGDDQRVGRAREDRLHRARADARAEQLLTQLHDVAPRDPVSDRERHDRRLQPGPVGAGRLGWQHRGRLGAAARASHALAAVLGDPDGHHRQLLDLVTRRISGRDALGDGEDVPAVAALGPVLNDFIDGPQRQQRPALALMAGLTARLLARRIPAALRRRARRIGARRLRGVARGAPARLLELFDPLVLHRDALFQTGDLLVHPKQHRHHSIAALLADRFGVGAIHAP